MYVLYYNSYMVCVNFYREFLFVLNRDVNLLSTPPLCISPSHTNFCAVFFGLMCWKPMIDAHRMHFCDNVLFTTPLEYMLKVNDTYSILALCITELGIRQSHFCCSYSFIDVMVDLLVRRGISRKLTSWLWRTINQWYYTLFSTKLSTIVRGFCLCTGTLILPPLHVDLDHVSLPWAYVMRSSKISLNSQKNKNKFSCPIYASTSELYHTENPIKTKHTVPEI